MKGINLKDLSNPQKIKEFYISNKAKIKKYGLPLLVLIALIILWLSGAVNSADGETMPATNTIESEYNAHSEEHSIEIYVDISGEVKNPGVYRVGEGDRIFQVIELAGGLTDLADTSSLNQAEVVYDGEKIVVERIGDDVDDGLGGSSKSGISSNGKVNINKADIDTLQSLPGIGMSKAQRIIDYRDSNGRFKSIEDIKNVSGIGDTTYENLKNMISVN